MDFKKVNLIKVSLLMFIIFIGFNNSRSSLVNDKKIEIDAYNISVDLDGQIYDESYLYRYNQ